MKSNKPAIIKPPATEMVEAPAKQTKADAKTICAELLKENHNFCTFWGNLYYESDGLWVQISEDDFSRLAYHVLGISTRRAAISDLYHLFRNFSADLTYNAQYIAFGDKTVFDMEKLDFVDNVPFGECFYRIKSSPNISEITKPTPIKFINEIAGGDAKIYDDILQSMATIFMVSKPAGVIWWLGGGANGKSTIAKLLHKIFNGYLCDIDIKGLEDGRDAPILNGKLANIGKESSDSFVEDSKIYKSIGTHEDIFVHKFHAQDMTRVAGNITTILSANKIPVFADKTFGARRRTILIRFTQSFEDNKSFEDKILASSLIKEKLLAQMIYYARKIKKNRGYDWSEKTIAEKVTYDEGANSALTYVRAMVDQGLLGALNYRSVFMHYQNWCEVNGYNSLSRSTLKNELDEAGFALRSQRMPSGEVRKVLALEGAVTAEMTFDGARYGLAFEGGKPRVAATSGEDGVVYKAQANVASLNEMLGSTNE